MLIVEIGIFLHHLKLNFNIMSFHFFHSITCCWTSSSLKIMIMMMIIIIAAISAIVFIGVSIIATFIHAIFNCSLFGTSNLNLRLKRDI